MTIAQFMAYIQFFPGWTAAIANRPARISKARWAAMLKWLEQEYLYDEDCPAMGRASHMLLVQHTDLSGAR